MGAVRAHKLVDITHVDTAVRWRSTNDIRLWTRLSGGTFQALFDTFRVFLSFVKSKPDVIHLCTSGSLGIPKDILILIIAKVFHIRSVLHYHRGDLPKIIKKKSTHWKLMRLAILLADTTLLLDQDSEDSAKIALPQALVYRIPNPIDIGMIRKANSYKKGTKALGSTPQIVFAGWVIPTKGVKELVAACAQIKDVPFELNLVGNVLDGYHDELELIAATRDQGNWLKFHGMLEHSQAIKVICSADIFILPSHTEGFPNVLLEAMAMGRPIIATRVGAIPEMLSADTSEPCGILIPPHSVDELSKAIYQLLTNPQEAASYGEKAKQKAYDHYAIDRVIEQYICLWQSLNNQ